MDPKDEEEKLDFNVINFDNFERIYPD